MSDPIPTTTSGGGGARSQHGWLERRFAVLFYSLLLSIAALPILNILGFDSDIIEYFLGLNLLAAAVAIDRGNVRTALLAVVALALIARLGFAWLREQGYGGVSLAVWSLVALVAAANALRFALTARAVHSEHVYAVLGAYLLVGLFFGVTYHVLGQFVPGSFAVGGMPSEEGLSVSNAIYFSFVTIATLGYGDIVPLGDAARGLVIIEAVGGQLYIAVLVARLVNIRA